MNIATFDDLLRAARQQPEPQRLLFVFARAELPDDSTPEQRLRFAAGEGGTLAPLMCVDKSPDELGTFADLVEESRELGQAWTLVFVAGSRRSRGAGADERGRRSTAAAHGRVDQGGLGGRLHPLRPQWQAGGLRLRRRRRRPRSAAPRALRTRFLALQRIREIKSDSS